MFRRMSDVREKADVDASITKFYDGKSILITGAAGFVGVVLLEILLRCCSGIKSIYILLREKKGVSPKDRKEELFKRSLFNKLREEDPGIFSKVHVIPGDVSLPGMAMSEEDLSKVVEQVSVVFHCAASISFTKSLKFLLSHNAGGVDNVIELCKRLKRCEALVYTSTAYCNCNRKLKIEERIYRLPYTAEQFLDAMKTDDDERLNQLASDCKPDWPNFYAFSKCLSENVIIEKASGIPTAIIRPSLIGSVWKGALPGYVEENSSLAQLFIAVGKGFLKVLKVNPELTLDFVPVDVVANAHIISGWALATRRRSSPFVVNCTSEGSYTCVMGDHIEILTELFSKNTLPNSFRYTDNCWLVNHSIKNKLMIIYEHYIPALAMDLALLLKGEKPRVVSLYRFLDKVMSLSAYFVCNSWRYETDNFKSLEHIVNLQDKKVFYTDLENFELRSYANTITNGAPFYDWKNDEKSKTERTKEAKRVYFFTRIVQATSIAVVCLTFGIVISQLVNKFLVY